MIVLTSVDSALVLNECFCAIEGHMMFEKRRNFDKIDTLLQNYNQLWIPAA